MKTAGFAISKLEVRHWYIWGHLVYLGLTLYYKVQDSDLPQNLGIFPILHRVSRQLLLPNIIFYLSKNVSDLDLFYKPMNIPGIFTKHG